MPDIMSLALLERGDRTLVAHRKGDRPPFAGKWLLPGAVVADDESAEEALGRHAYKEFGIDVREPQFAETLYLEETATAQRYVANVFRVSRYDGELRLRSAGDYQDARWLRNDELYAVQVPIALRDWLRGSRQADAPAAYRIAGVAGAPDNRAGWNAIAKAYQERFAPATDRLTYGPRCPGEDELQLIGDVTGLRCIVLGCGGGQDCVVLAKQGAAHVIGIDLSDEQIAFGRKLAEREGVLVTLLQGSVEELKGIDDESQELAMSLYALAYVEHADRALAEAYRVLRPGAPFVMSVGHPFYGCLEREPPFGVEKPYWEVEEDWSWDFDDAKASGRLRSWTRPVSEWFRLLTDAGFRVERLLEPELVEEESPWDASYGRELMQLVPSTLIIRAVKV
jgi:ubiquinone/menaquinone biosynthesis C-methylase UbiE/ADP-ribose pyrophosphatase YjhB (NUDIX family)